MNPAMLQFVMPACRKGLRSGRALIALAAIVLCAGRTRADVITLPVEVTGSSSTAQATPVTLSASDSPVTSIQIQITGLEYANQVSVQINGGSWIPLNNSTAQSDPVSARWGGIGGPVTNQTVTIPVPAGAVANGAPASVAFQFNGTDGFSNGFRVLGFNFVRADASLALPASTFRLDDPTLWTAPMADAGNIAAGQQLWQTQPLVASSLPNAPAISAHCGDCHTADGHDLKYFNYSNATIIARSMFHGLTQLQGQQIASYIRSLPGPAPGRPWNPPYQPGPGIDSQPVSSWAAGAGLQWVLPNDMAMIPYLFPNGLNRLAIATTGYLDTRQTPIPLPLPTWNQWLPRIHPMDFWGSTFTTSQFCGMYPIILAQLANVQAAGTMATYLQAGFNSQTVTWEVATFEHFKEAYVIPITNWTPAISEGVYSTGKWHMVKMWEIMQKYGLENQGVNFFGSGPLTEPFTWVAAAAFNTAPKALLIPENDGTAIGGLAMTQHYYTDGWYNLQLIQNPGNGRLNATNPIDWAYDYGVLDHTAMMTGAGTAVRTLEFMAKAMQETDNGKPPSTAEAGWSPQGTDGIFQIEHDQKFWAGIPAATQGKLLTALMGAWLVKTSSISPSLYYSGGITLETDTPNLRNDLWGPGARWVDQTGWMINEFRKMGAENSACNAVCTWAQTVWPDFNWSQYMN